MISILAPSRKRPDWLHRMMQSATLLADNPNDVEFIFYIDDDDDSYEKSDVDWNGAKFITGPKIPISDMWNKCQEEAVGPIYMQAADDIMFTTEHWDTKVKEAFDRFPDKIALVFGNDGHPSRGDNHGTHPFLHKNWVDAVGYFLPPGFVADWSDQWINDVASDLGRHVYLPDVITEHLHPALGKGAYDTTYLMADQKRAADRPDVKYTMEKNKRLDDVDKLRKVMQ